MTQNSLRSNIAGVVIEDLQRHEDKRGSLFEMFRSAPAGHTPVMGYASVTGPRQVRGPHEHREQTDLFVFPSNSFLQLWLWDNRPNSSTYGSHFIVATGLVDKRVLVPPGVVHAYANMMHRSCTVFNFPDRYYRGISGQEPVDEIRWEDDPQNPFVPTYGDTQVPADVVRGD